MALDLVTGYKGQNHVTAEQWADFNRGIYGDAAILPIGNKMQVEIQTANQITVKDGTGVFDGRQVYIGYGESENIAIESGTQEMLRNDIVVIKYTKDETSGVESVAFEVVTGTPAESDPADPSYQDMDIRTGVFVSQKPFCRVRLNGVAIEEVDMLVEVKELADHAFNPPVANLTTTEPGRALDATMGKQLKDDFDQLTSRIHKIDQNLFVSAQTSYFYTGLSVTIPANSYFVLTARCSWGSSRPVWVGIASDSESDTSQYAEGIGEKATASCTYSGFVEEETTFYIWAKWSATGDNAVLAKGFYITDS